MKNVRTFRYALFVLVVTALAPVHAESQMLYIPDPQNKNSLRRINPSRSRQNLVFKGNVRVSESVLRQELGIKSNPKVNETIADRYARKLLRYYHSAGYTLARIQSRCNRKRCFIIVDEGLLNNIYIFGHGWKTTFVLRNSLFPGKIFNKRQLEQELKVWASRPEIQEVNYELRRNTRTSDSVLGSMIDSITDVQHKEETLVSLSRRARYDIYIYFHRFKHNPGGHAGIKLSTYDGVELNGRYVSNFKFFSRDSFYIGGRFSALPRPTIDPVSKTSLFFLKTGADIRYATSPLRRGWLRLLLDSRTSLKAEQRPDLPLDRFFFLQTTNTFKVEFRLFERSYVNLFFGHDLRTVGGEKQVASDPFAPPDRYAAALITGGEIDFLFGRARPARHRNDILKVRTILNIPDHGRDFFEIRGEGRMVYLMEPADIYLGLEAFALLRDFEFFDEESIRDVGSRSNFDRALFVDKAVTPKFEYRFKLAPDELEVGIFDDFTFFWDRDETTNIESLRYANAAGASVYLILANIFELHLRYAFGITNDNIRSHDFFASFEKVF